MVDESGMTVVSKHCLCIMFIFQPCSLHISKDVLYDSNNLVSSLLYQIPTTSSQGHQWDLSYDQYRIIGDSLIHNSQDTILMPGIACFVVKIVKDEHKVLNTFP